MLVLVGASYALETASSHTDGGGFFFLGSGSSPGLHVVEVESVSGSLAEDGFHEGQGKDT